MEFCASRYRALRQFPTLAAKTVHAELISFVYNADLQYTIRTTPNFTVVAEERSSVLLKLYGLPYVSPPSRYRRGDDTSRAPMRSIVQQERSRYRRLDDTLRSAPFRTEGIGNLGTVVSSARR